MDKYGFIILLIGALLFMANKKHRMLWGFVVGIGVGIIVGAVGSYLIVMSILP